MKVLRAVVFCMGILLIGVSAHAFSDADLEKYQGGGNRVQRDEPISTGNSRKTYQTQSDNRATAAQPDNNAAQAWCDKGRSADDRIEVAERNVIRTSSTSSSVTNVYGDRYTGASAVSDAKQAADMARRELDDAKTAKRRLEDDAHRQNIPAGWLRCQF